ncbi:hypothetical protein [Burkholderia cepacia]|uniref:hypothetical protein n=1 Tax=Burkholderia cepacia TaxID=292 RepID=UPI002ABD2115|nr:hypothetical protein [Burkholderia cepacia]
MQPDFRLRAETRHHLVVRETFLQAVRHFERAALPDTLSYTLLLRTRMPGTKPGAKRLSLSLSLSRGAACAPMLATIGVSATTGTVRSHSARRRFADKAPNDIE